MTRPNRLRLLRLAFLCITFVASRSLVIKASPYDYCIDICTNYSWCGQGCVDSQQDIITCGDWGTCMQCGDNLCQSSGEATDTNWCSTDCGSTPPDGLCHQCDPKQPSTWATSCGDADFSCTVAQCCVSIGEGGAPGAGGDCNSNADCTEYPFTVCYDGFCAVGYPLP
jgi:hypothetical protein